jgi:hypothetical protein
LPLAEEVITKENTAVKYAKIRVEEAEAVGVPVDRKANS